MRKNNTSRTKDPTWRDISEGTGERKKTKNILRQEQIIQKNMAFQNKRKFYQQVWRESAKTVQQPDAERQNDFAVKYGNGGSITKSR